MVSNQKTDTGLELWFDSPVLKAIDWLAMRPEDVAKMDFGLGVLKLNVSVSLLFIYL